MKLAAILAISLTCITFLVFQFLFYSATEAQNGQNPVKQLVYQRFWGFILFGLVPVAVIWAATGNSPADLGVSTKNFANSLLWTAILGAIVVPVVYLNSIYSKDAEEYNHFSPKHFNKYFLINSTWSWILYLLGYEVLFRGLLLFSTIKIMPVEVAVTLNVALYSLVHLPKGAKQTIGAIPLGLVLCIITLHTGTFWVAFFTHVIMALTNDYAQYRKNKKTLQAAGEA